MTSSCGSPVLNWRKEAACLAVEDKWIFNETRPDSEDAASAAKICESCPVLRECYQWAAGEKHYEGIAAGWIWLDSAWHRRQRC